MDDSADQDQRVMRLLAAALKRPAAERKSYLSEECGDDLDLLHEVSEAVEWEDRMGDFLRRPLVACPDMDRPFQPGEIVSSRFEIIREVGEGGMGVVYEAFDRKRQHRICVKTAKLGFRRALSPELEGALRVRHPNICVVNEIHTAQTPEGEIDFLTMEFIEGETLSAWLTARGRLAPADALRAAQQLCAAVAEAHRSGVIHRDLKAGNVMLSRDQNDALRAVVTDFGLAGDVAEYAGYLGTPRYMAPELWNREPATQKSDVYALGVVLYELVTGVGPGAYPAPPTTVVPELDARWDRAVMPCLKRSPAGRPDVQEVLDRLRRKPRSRRPAYAAAALLALAGVGAAIPEVRTAVVRRFYPPSVRLAILPLETAPEDAATAGGALQEAADRIRRMQRSSSTLVVIAPTDALDQNVHNATQAGQILHATHALETSLRHEGDRWLLNSGVLDLQTHDRTGDFSAVYTANTLGTLPVALAGSVASTLRLKSSEAEPPLQAAAARPYFSGLYFLRRDRRSFEQAIPLFNEAARLDPRSPLPQAALSEAFIQRFQAISDRKALDEAQRSLAAARSLNPDSVRVLLVTGLLDQTAGRYEKALESYRRVEEREPRNVEAQRRIADVYDKMDMPDKAIAAFRQAIALEPGYYWTYSQLGALYYFRGNYPQAAEQFRNAIARAPGVLQPYINLGGVLSDLGRDAEAEQALFASLRIKETDGALNSLGAIRAFQKRDAEAVEYYQRAIAGNPNRIIYHLNLGDSTRRLGRTVEAVAAYRAGQQLAAEELKQNPRNAITRAYAGYFATRLGDRARGEDEIAQAVQLGPTDGTVIRNAVLTYQALGQTERALDALANSTPELIRELDRHPDLTEFRKHPRFVQLTGTAGFQTGGR